MTESRRVIYTAQAQVTGGRAAGHGRSSDGALEVDLRMPVEMGGSGGGTNPEQLFIEVSLTVNGRDVEGTSTPVVA